ncbi:MAG: hypothetical protein ABH950_08190 [Candidatus Altiarchaeota archaeon]
MSVERQPNPVDKLLRAAIFGTQLKSSQKYNFSADRLEASDELSEITCWLDQQRRLEEGKKDSWDIPHLTLDWINEIVIDKKREFDLVIVKRRELAYLFVARAKGSGEIAGVSLFEYQPLFNEMHTRAGYVARDARTRSGLGKDLFTLGITLSQTPELDCRFLVCDVHRENLISQALVKSFGAKEKRKDGNDIIYAIELKKPRMLEPP